MIKRGGTTLYLSELEEGEVSKELAHQILFQGIRDDDAKCDCIVVPSSRTSNKYRTPAAVELFFQGRSSRLLFSGGYNGEFIESESMRSFAIERGIPEKAIIIETISTNTKENVIESLAALDNHIGLNNMKRILICTAFYHMRRCHLTFLRYAPSWFEYSFHPVLDQTTRPDNWWKYENGTKRVQKEVNGLIHYAKHGDIMDFNLDELR